MELLLARMREWREVTCDGVDDARGNPGSSGPTKKCSATRLSSWSMSIHHGRLHPANTAPRPSPAPKMSSGDESAPELSSDDDDTPQQLSRASSRPPSQTPGTPRKRRRIESVEPSRVRKYYLEGKYSDAYRVLFNQDVARVAARFEPEPDTQHYTAQYGASTWTGTEQATLFAALERLGRDDVAGIAQAVGTKTITETHELLLLLSHAAATKGDIGLTLRDVPAAIEVGQACDEELDVMAEALAWYQEQWEIAEEQKRYGDHWLITPALAGSIESAVYGPSRAVSTRPTTPTQPGTPRTGSGIAGYVHATTKHTKRSAVTC